MLWKKDFFIYKTNLHFKGNIKLFIDWLNPLAQISWLWREHKVRQVLYPQSDPLCSSKILYMHHFKYRTYKKHPSKRKKVIFLCIVFPLVKAANTAAKFSLSKSPMLNIPALRNLKLFSLHFIFFETTVSGLISVCRWVLLLKAPQACLGDALPQIFLHTLCHLALYFSDVVTSESSYCHFSEASIPGCSQPPGFCQHLQKTPVTPATTKIISMSVRLRLL